MGTVHDIGARIPPGARLSRERKAFLELSDERDWWQARVLKAERAGYQRGVRDGQVAGFEQGYASGREDGRAEACVFSAEIHSDEAAERHWASTREWLAALSRNERFLADARATKPSRRTYDQIMALEIRDGLRIATRQLPADPDFDPAGAR